MSEHYIGKDEEERQELFADACEAIESKLRARKETMRAAVVVKEITKENKQFNGDLVQQALWSLVEGGRVQMDGKLEVKKMESPGVV